MKVAQFKIGDIIFVKAKAKNAQQTEVAAIDEKEKFPEGPWCKEGEWVIFGSYAGSRFKIEGGEVRILNDDEIIARINNPEDILHAY